VELKTLLDNHHVPWTEIGATQESSAFDVDLANGSFSIPLDTLRAAHTGRLAEVIYG